LITNSSSRLFSFVAAISLLLQSNTICLASNIVSTSQSSDSDAILGLDMAPSSLPTVDKENKSTSGGALVASVLPQAVTPAASSPLLLTTAKPVSIALKEETAIAAAQPLVAAAQPSADDQALLRGGINVSPSVAETRVDDLTRQILLKLIELERFNIHYTLEVAKQGRWKAWRYGGLQEVNAGMGLTGSIIGTAERGSHIHSPTKVHIELQESANYIPMIGSIIGATAAAMEMGINEYHELQAGRHGFSPRVAVAHVTDLKNQINRLLAERDALTAVEATAPNLAGHVTIDQAEGKVLRDLRDESLQEFERFHIGARRLFAFQQAQYAFDLAKYTCNAIGYDYAYNALHRHHRYMNLRAGIWFDVAGSLYITGPILSRVFAKGIAESHRHRLRPTTDDAEAMKVEQLVADRAALDHILSSGNVSDAQPSVDRAAMYGAHEKVFQDEVRSAEKKNSKAKLTATQNVGGGVFVGGLKLASGVLFTVVGSNHNYNTKSDRSAKVTNTNLFVGSVLGIPAGVYSLLDTMRIQVRGEIDRHRLAKAGLLPGQLATIRLAQLDATEAKLKAGK
jgi:hypothetical protein